MEVVVTTGAIRRVKLQSNCYHQYTNTQLFRPDVLAVARPTVQSSVGKDRTLQTKNIMLLTVVGPTSLGHSTLDVSSSCRYISYSAQC